jgi:hypothetical protein
MGNSNRTRFILPFLAITYFLATSNALSQTSAKQGSAALCNTIGPRVVAADAELAPAAQMAVALGTDDTEVLSGTHAHHGSAYKLVEDDATALPTLFHTGMNAVTEGQIAANSLSAPDEVALANNTLQSYSISLNAVEEFGKFALLYERSVNSKNRRAAMVSMNEAFAALGNYNSSTSTLNASCFGNSCYGTARTSSYQSNSSGANLQAAAIGASAVAGQQYSLDQATPSMIDLTQKIDNYQYGYRRLRAVWMSACPSLNFPNNWVPATVTP